MYAFKRFISAQLYLVKIMFTSTPFHTSIYWLLVAAKEAVPVVNVYVWKLIIDELTEIYATGKTGTRAFALIGFFLGLTFLSSLLGNLREYLGDEISDISNKKLDENVMRQCARLESEYFNNPANADRIMWASYSQNSIVRNFSWSVETIMKTAAFGAALFVFLSISPLFGIIFLLTYVPGAIVSYRASKKIERFQWRRSDNYRMKDYYRKLLTEKKSAKDVRLYNISGFFKDKYDKVWGKLRRGNLKLFRDGTIKTSLASILSTVGIIVVITFSVNNILNGKLDALGTFTMYIGYAKTCGSSFSALISSIVTQFSVTSPRIIAYRTFCSDRSDVHDDGEKEAPRLPRIEFHNVTFTYPGSNKPALNNMTFVIESGEVVALIGVNGAGKTTIVRLLLRFYEPDSGEILLNGINIKEFSLASLRKVFGVCFQDVTGYSMSIEENVVLSRAGEDNTIYEKKKDELERAAVLSGLDKVMEGWENGWSTQMTREFFDYGKELSGGQWQKVGLARCFYGDADIMILDEPSSALDAEAEDAIFSSFSNLCRNKGGILISHRLSSVIMVDKILFISEGSIQSVGSHEQLMKENKKYAELYHLQAEKYHIGRDN